jgi:hypothetical protein
MNTNIFIPKKINVGFQNRSDTYTKKLAYIIYYDEKNVLRKEKSWNGWRDSKIDNIEFENVPTSGFVLNKKAGGYSTGWNHRQTYVRVYDERDFEFEITVPNLLYILENATSTKGKGLEGEFIYGWDGKDLLLVPVDSPDYKEISEVNKIIHENKSIKAKELIIGATYKTKDNEDLIYMGKFDDYGYYNHSDGKKFWFYNRKTDYSKFTTMKTIPKNKLIHVLDSNCCNDYADLFDELECYYYYSPIDNSKDEYEHYDLDHFTEFVTSKVLSQRYYWSKAKVYCDLGGDMKTQIIIQRKNNVESCTDLKAYVIRKRMEKYQSSWVWGVNRECEREVEYEDIIAEGETIEKLFNKLKPQYKNIYLKNGKLKGGIRNNE